MTKQHCDLCDVVMETNNTTSREQVFVAGKELWVGLYPYKYTLLELCDRCRYEAAKALADRLGAGL